jgi:hypothetical protein
VTRLAQFVRTASDPSDHASQIVYVSLGPELTMGKDMFWAIPGRLSRQEGNTPTLSLLTHLYEMLKGMVIPLTLVSINTDDQ